MGLLVAGLGSVEAAWGEQSGSPGEELQVDLKGDFAADGRSLVSVGVSGALSPREGELPGHPPLPGAGQGAILSSWPREDMLSLALIPQQNSFQWQEQRQNKLRCP